MGTKASRVRVTGPLMVYAPGFASELTRSGYTENATADQVRLLAHLSRWLAAQGLDAGDLTPEVGDAFLVARRAVGYTLWLSRKALVPLLQYLRGIDVAPAEPCRPLGPTDELLGRYRDFLNSERGLAASTVNGYVNFVQPFVRRREAADGTLLLEDLTPQDITAFVVTEVPGRPTGSAKLTVTALRSLLGFLHVEGVVASPLTSAVPSVAGTRLAGLPKALGAEEVQRLLRSCDRTTAVGRRDFAVLTMLARLGMRRGEVASLTLDDIHWRVGEIVVRGKGDRHEILPLPVDVGRAVADYLRRGRPVTESRRVFLRVRAPHRPLTPGGTTAIVIGAACKAGLPPMGAHRLRHTVATEILRAGAPLAEVGQLLRHRSSLSTAIYAKVNRNALREIARPWPTGGAA